MQNLKPGSDVVGLCALLESAQKLMTKSGKPYVRLSVRNEHGSLPGVLWDIDSGLAPSLLEKLPIGKSVVLSGQVGDYNGKPQLSVTSLTLGDEDPKKYAKNTPYNTADMWDSVCALVDNFREPVTKFVAKALLETPALKEAFLIAPAATGVHNNWYGGLLEHVYSLCRVAGPVISHYKTNYFPNLSSEKVYFGLIFHDAGKVVEYDSENPAFPKTGLGVLTNHIVLGPAWVFEKANLLPQKPANFKEERAHLMHILAAHHGRIDWGSPVVPATAEALLVHHLDNLDSKMLHAFGMIKDQPGEIEGFSARSRYEGTPFLKKSVGEANV